MSFAAHSGMLSTPHSPVVGLEPTLAESQAPKPRALCNDIEAHIRQAERAVFSHVGSHGCTDLDLKLRILDWKTRVVELEMMGYAEEVCPFGEQRLTRMIHNARKDVIACIKQEPCTDIELRIKVLDLETRVVEKNKMLEGN